MGSNETPSFEWPSQNPVKLSNILNALYPEELPDFPLLTPVRQFNCTLCPWKFYSTMNVTRHLHIHDQDWSQNGAKKRVPFKEFWDESSMKKRPSVKEFWDKLSSKAFKDIVSFKDVDLKGLPGYIIVHEASRLKPDIRLPAEYLKARKRLLEIVRFERPEFPISSDEFFGILDETSEHSFLCSDMDESYEDSIFYEGAEHIVPEHENLVASISFLLEKKLVKAWLQSSLVKEEEDAKRRCY
ncbi:unnamed protein product [Rhodiola kirilowii]